MMSEQPKKLKKLTKLQAEKSWLLTQECYCKALVETYPKELEGAKPESFRELGTDRELRSHLKDLGLDTNTPDIHRRYMSHMKKLTTKQLETNTPDIHRRYMSHMKKLSTEQLETIIVANDQGLVRRAPHTIDEIQLEILDRTLTGVTNES